MEVMMLELFVVGGFWFWMLIVAELALLFVFTEYENGICATVSLVAFVVALQFCGNANPVGTVLTNWYYLIPLILAYLGIGCSWGIFKWRKLVHDRLAQHNELYADFLKEKKLPASTTDLSYEMKVAWSEVVEKTKDHKTQQTVADTPQARQHKARITRWMSLWPFSVSLYCFKDMVAEVFTALYKRLATFLQRIADQIYGKANVKANLVDLEKHREEVRQQQMAARQQTA
jgi:hypothetical protein